MITYKKVILMGVLQVLSVLGLGITLWIEPDTRLLVSILSLVVIFNLKMFLWWSGWVNRLLRLSEKAVGHDIGEHQTFSFRDPSRIENNLKYLCSLRNAHLSAHNIIPLDKQVKEPNKKNSTSVRKVLVRA